MAINTDGENSSSSQQSNVPPFIAKSDTGTENSSRQSKDGKAIELLSCGFISGVLQSIIFNPVDKALYLSIKVYVFLLIYF